jgi:hypothetical protein
MNLRERNSLATSVVPDQIEVFGSLENFVGAFTPNLKSKMTSPRKINEDENDQNSSELLRSRRAKVPS